MKKAIVVYLLAISSCNLSFSQEDFVMWNKLSPEIRLNIEDIPLEIRWRPVDYLITPTVQYGRTDFMIGVKFWKFKLFSYSKYDELERLWTGARLDFNLSLFNKRLLINLQERYFWGLNDITHDQFYLVDLITFRIAKRVHLGALSYGQWYVDRPIEDGLLSIGPVINIILPFNFNILVTSGKEIFHEGRYITIFRLGYRIFWKNQNKPIDFGI